MYSVVLLMALSSGVESPDFGKKKADCSGCTSCVGCTGCYTSCSGCTGCSGTVIYGCSSCSGYTGCSTSCSGCDGCTSTKRGLFGKKKAKDCSGCTSSCTVSCTSSCHGYTGCTTSCTGGYISCTGGCSGTVIIGCTGTIGCTTGCTTGCTGGVIVVPETKPMPKTGLDTPAPATISVKLPANAKLVIDDYVTSSTSTTRTFVTPALDPTKEYTYTLKAEINNNGKTEVKTETITVRGGRETAVTINFETGSVASK